MATKKNGLTRADALAFALERCADNPEVVAVLWNMHKTITKPRAKAVSKARVANEGLARKVHAEIVKHGDGVTTTEVVGFGFPEIQTTQKASAVCRVGVELGLLRKCVNGKAITYAIA